MDVNVAIIIRYDRTENVGPGKTVVTTENIQINDTVPEETVKGYIQHMTPVVNPV